MLMYYLRIEGDRFGFIVEDIHEILNTDIPISKIDYDSYFAQQSEGAQFRLKVEPTGESLFDYVETFENVETPMEKTLIEVIKEEQDAQKVSIDLTEDAINFILMGEIDTYNTRSKSTNSMASYLGNQIYKGKLDYEKVIARYPEFEEDIDIFLGNKINNNELNFK